MITPQRFARSPSKQAHVRARSPFLPQTQLLDSCEVVENLNVQETPNIQVEKTCDAGGRAKALSRTALL